MKIFRDESKLMNKALQFYELIMKTRSILKTKSYLAWEMNLICWKHKIMTVNRKALKFSNKFKFCVLKFQSVTKKFVMFALRSKWQLVITNHVNAKLKFWEVIFKNSKECVRDNNHKFINLTVHYLNGSKNVLHKIQGLEFWKRKENI